MVWIRLSLSGWNYRFRKNMSRDRKIVKRSLSRSIKSLLRQELTTSFVSWRYNLNRMRQGKSPRRFLSIRLSYLRTEGEV